MNINTALSPEQAKFAVLLEEKAPFLLPLWDFEARAFIPEKVDHFLSVASKGEQFMCRFFIGIWTHHNMYEFDVFEAMAVLDEKQRNTIAEWIKAPFWA